MKLWERIVENRRIYISDLKFSNQQCDFMPGKSTTGALFALRVLMEKYRDGQKELHCMFVDLEKAYAKMPSKEVWYYSRTPDERPPSPTNIPLIRPHFV